MVTPPINAFCRAAHETIVAASIAFATGKATIVEHAGAPVVVDPALLRAFEIVLACESFGDAASAGADALEEANDRMRMLLESG